MADRPAADPFCPSCGTEVDEDARFCPTCGRTLMLDEDAQPEAAPLAGAPLAGSPQAPAPDEDEPMAPAAEPDTMTIPPAPAWPPPDPEPEPAAPVPHPERGPDVPAQAQAAPPSAGAPAPSVPPAGAAAPRGPAADLPITWPVTLSAWLIGAGSLAAALTLLVRLGNPINLLIFVALLAITASVFLADRVPTIPHQRLAILVVLTISLGVALERAAFRIQGVETIFLIAMIVAGGGALLLEMGRDRPVPPLGGAG